MPATLLETRVASAPVVFEGAALRAKKVFVDGTHRCVPPEATLARISPLLRAAGITRLADVSGLDRVGFTTVVSIRPNAKLLSTSAGKGFSRTAAYVSAAMEGIEMHHAENPTLAVIDASYDELSRAHAVISPDRLPFARQHRFSRSRPEAWVRGWDLIAGQSTYVPYLSVALVRPPSQSPALDFAFTVDSNGLASGNHLLEAMSSALCELIERDAVSCHRVAGARTAYRPPLVDLDALTMPLVQDLLTRFAQAGLRAAVRDCTVDTCVPVFMAQLFDERDRHVGIFGGWGAHLDAEIALVRAMTEAAQSRVIFVSGARDDIFRLDERMARHEDTASTVAKLSAPGTRAHTAQFPGGSTSTFEGDIHVLVERLSRAGARQVIIVDLTRDDFGVPVVRAIVPDLEGYYGPDYVAGPRATAFTARCRTECGA